MTTFALARLLKELLVDMGVGELKADALAQVHLQQTTIPAKWSEFIVLNCASCSKSTATCDYLNPKPENCVEGATPSSLKAAHAMMIESGRIEYCPSFLPLEQE